MLRLRFEQLALSSALALVGCQPDPAPAAKTKTTEAAPAAKAETKAPAPKKAADANAVDPKPENVFATVDGKEVDMAEIAARFKLKMDRLPDDKRTRTQQQRWLQRVTEEVVWQTAYQTAVDKEGLEVDYSSADKAIADFREVPEVFERYLKKNAESESSIRAQHVYHANEQALLKARGLEEPTIEDAKKFYEENKEKFKRDTETMRASHFLVAEGPREGMSRVKVIDREQREKATPEELAKWKKDALAYAEYLRKEVMKPGVDFNEFTLEHSEGPGRSRGGDMGIFDRRQMVPDYTEVAFALKPGEISEVTDTSKGIYVIKCFGKYEPGILPYEALEPDLLRQLEAMRFQEAKRALREELKKNLAIDWGMKAPAEDKAEAPAKAATAATGSPK